MEVKEAVRTAKTYVADLLADEGLMYLGLEEVERDEDDHTWRVTVGFSREWNSVRNALSLVSGDPALNRAYRVVTIRDDGQVISLKKREGTD